MKQIAELLVRRQSTLREVLERGNATRCGVVLVVDEDGRFVDVITDGDMRRAVLAERPMDSTAAELIAAKGPRRAPIVASTDASHGELVALVRATGVSHVPVLDKDRRAQRLVTLEDLLNEDELQLQAVVMAGGKGTRLHPLTENTPKPMLEVGGRPLMERIIGQLTEAGIRQVSITTHFRPEKITEHFGDGARFGVSLNYVAENEQLGTAGGLALMRKPEATLLVINGDILTEVDFKAMLAFHREHRAAMTLAVRQYAHQVPYGVIETEGAQVRDIREKPVQQCFVNAGIYLVEPQAHALVPSGRRFDMTDLIRALLARGMPVVSFPIWEYWRDIGRHDDYEKAQADVKDGTVS